ERQLLIRNTILKLKEPKGVVHFERPAGVNDFTKILATRLD
ncbi:6441_t:CDS:2, partial [Funneliformis geosporum]